MHKNVDDPGTQLASFSFTNNFASVADVCFNSEFADLTIVYPKLQEKDTIFRGIFFKNEAMRKMCDGGFGDYNQKTLELTITQEEDEKPFRNMLKSLFFPILELEAKDVIPFLSMLHRYEMKGAFDKVISKLCSSTQSLHFGSRKGTHDNAYYYIMEQVCQLLDHNDAFGNLLLTEILNAFAAKDCYIYIDHSRFATFSLETINIVIQNDCSIITSASKLKLLIEWFKIDKKNRITDLRSMILLLQNELTLTDKIPLMLFQLYKESDNQLNAAILHSIFSSLHLVQPPKFILTGEPFFILKPKISVNRGDGASFIHHGTTLKASTSIVLTAIKLSNPIQTISHTGICRAILRILDSQQTLEEIEVSLPVDGGETVIPLQVFIYKESSYIIRLKTSTSCYYEMKYTSDTEYELLPNELVNVESDEYQFAGFQFQTYKIEHCQQIVKLLLLLLAFCLGLALSQKVCIKNSVNLRWAPCGDVVAATTSSLTEGTVLGQQTIANCKFGVDKWTNVQLTSGGGKVWVASSFVDSCGSGPSSSGTVLGKSLKPVQMNWMTYIAKQVLPKLTIYYGGDANTALTNAAYVAWWSLKEGALEIDTPSFNLCDPGHKVLTKQWDGICAKESGFGTWQVGIAAIQSPITVEKANQMIPNLETICRKTGVDPANALRQIAVESGFGNVKEAIAASRDRLRASWLLRVPYIAFVLQGPQVKSECFGANVRNWCFSSAWYPSNMFAPTLASIPQAYNDVKNLLQKLR